MNKKLTALQAFTAMRKFLEYYYEKNHSDDLCDLLTGISTDIWEDGGTADPAYWVEWGDAIHRVVKRNETIQANGDITLLEAFEAVKEFLKNYCTYIQSDSVNNIIKDMQSNNPKIWNDWMRAVQSL